MGNWKSLQRPVSLADEAAKLRLDPDIRAENEDVLSNTTAARFRTQRAMNMNSALQPPTVSASSLNKKGATAAAANVLKEKDKVSASGSKTKKPSSGMAVTTAKATAKAPRCPFARLHVVSSTHKVSTATQQMLQFVGGLARLNRSITRFYNYAFANPHLKLFFRDTSDPHALRLARWIAEKMGDVNQPWTRDCYSRDLTPKVVAGGRTIVIRDRSSAHVAAWHSPKREAHKVGQHFKLDDCRLWLRLHFLAAREEGLFEHPNFQDWYVRFLSHFVRVYERTAQQFARESARWSESKERVARYHKAVANGLPEAKEDAVIGLSLGQALKQLPKAERAENSRWPYEQPFA